MAKNFLDELIIELLKLQAEDVDKARTAIENGEHVPAPASPKDIFHTVNRVAANHQVTAEEYSIALQLGDNVTEADLQVLRQLQEEK